VIVEGHGDFKHRAADAIAHCDRVLGEAEGY
jgi:hypothetical protein